MDSMIHELSRISGMPHIVLTDRGNTAIMEALKIAKAAGIKKVLIPDQGGWFSYKSSPVELGMEIEQIKTDYGVFDLSILKEKISEHCALLYENPAGYYAEQPVEEIYNVCKGRCLVILDVTGCIGRNNYSNCCDIMVGSFGPNKPVNLGYGGFIASNKVMNVAPTFGEGYYEKLNLQLGLLDDVYKGYEKIRKKIISDLSSYEILHKDKQGINVVVRFRSKEEMENLINYCNKNNFEFRKCPFYIRVKAKAISIEVKRVK